MQPRRKKYQTGCVFLDAKTKTWFFRYYVDGKRKAERIGTKKEFPTKTEAKQAAEPIRADRRGASLCTFLVRVGLARVCKEKMPSRPYTKRGYLTWADNYILPRWGHTPMPELKPRAVELWLSGLDLSPKSKSNIRMVFSVVFEYAMWAELIRRSATPWSLYGQECVQARRRHGQ